MHPTLEVVNGHTARIQIKERIPTPEKILSGNTIIDTIKYQDIIDFLEVQVQVYADGTIGLKTSAGIASKSPDGVEQVPVLTERQIDNTENRLKKGHSLVIGGILKKERISVVRSIPGLKHVPLIGTIFSGKDYEDRVKEILFILTPTISTNGMEYNQAVNIVQRKLEGQAPSFCNLSVNN
jgi:general secretion pathway protein D